MPDFRHKASRLIDLTARPFRVIIDHLPLFVVMSLLMAAPAMLSLSADTNAFHFAKAKFAVALFQSAGVACIITWILTVIPHRRTLTAFILAIMATLCAGEFFTFAHFSSRLGTNALMVILQTDRTEAGEFLSHYLLRWPSLLAIAVPLAILSLFWPLKSLQRLISRYLRAASLALAATFLISIFFLVNAAFPDLSGGKLLDYYSTPVQLATSTVELNRHRGEMRRLASTTRSATIDSVGDRPRNIILIIGESFNKHHASAYGYPHKTTPNIDSEISQGRLTLFNDIVSRHNFTAEALREIYSTHISSKGGNWGDYPLFTTLFDKAGYDVILLDNHATASNTSEWDFSSSFFLNIPEVKQGISYRNTDLYPYDMGLVDELDRLGPTDRPRLIILHLKGQHHPAFQRFPADFARFTPDDYPDSLTATQRREIADYDNATLYNDAVVMAILDRFRSQEAIAVYFSDHGEEVHDFRDHYGRTLEATTPQLARNLLEVPMMFWVSDSFAKAHPATVQQIRRAANRPGVNGDIAQTLLNLGAISAPYYDPVFDILSDHYRPYPRTIGTSFPYDTP